MTATTDRTASSRRFDVGSLVRARGREWVVLPDDPGQPDTLLLRPLGGTDSDAFGFSRELEGDDITSATFALPLSSDAGDAAAGALLRDAVRLSLRSGAGPFRSLGRIAVEPRPYQLVPLLMALRLDPVRLLIADDVGIGKTIEAGLIARELLDSGEVRRLAVLCPPHLCEQWRAELRDKFHIDAVVVRPGTVAALERGLPADRSLFDVNPFVIVSIDYIKGDRRRAGFIQHCPELVIVDEAHTCATGGTTGSQQQRHSLLRELATRPIEGGRLRHLVLATATPHSGIESAFRSLLELLDPDFADLPEDEAITASDPLRQRLRNHLVQRRRADIQHYLKEYGETYFPKRESKEVTYRTGTDGRRLLDGVLAYATELVRDAEGLGTFQRRVRWWAALALLRCVASSPAAAAATLRTRAAGLRDTETDQELDTGRLDELGERTIMDLDASDAADSDDVVPGADITAAGGSGAERDRLNRLARQAEALAGDGDPKLRELVTVLRDLIGKGFRPIVYCRFIATAEYLATELGDRLGGKRDAVDVQAVTGSLPPEERARVVAELQASPRRVLVATDCLSEGINLQGGFDAVIHYDLAWNPTRHEQREGRVDRYGQPSPVVRTVLISGEDNPVDAAILRVLLRKAEAIRKRLGVSVPVPATSSEVIEAVFETLFQRESPRQLGFALSDDLLRTPTVAKLDRQWAAEEQRQSRTIFAQQTIHADDVRQELDQAAAALGDHRATREFVRLATSRLQVPLTPVARPGGQGAGEVFDLDTGAFTGSLREAIEEAGLPGGTARIGFELPLPEGATHIARTHPLVETIAAHLTERALSGQGSPVVARSGAVRTAAVPTRTTLLLLRARMHLDVSRTGGQAGTDSLLAEECIVAAFRGSPREDGTVDWLEEDGAEALLGASATANIAPDARTRAIDRVLQNDLPRLGPALAYLVQRRADRTKDAHDRVRRLYRDPAGGARRTTVRPVTPADVLGVYVLLPAD